MPRALVRIPPRACAAIVAAVLLFVVVPAATAAVDVTASATDTQVSVGYTWSGPDTPTADPVLTFQYVSGTQAVAGAQWKYTVGTPVSSPVTVTAFDAARPAISSSCGNCLKSLVSTWSGSEWLPDGTYSVSLAVTRAGGTTTATAPSNVVINGPTRPPTLLQPTASTGATATRLTLSYTLPEVPYSSPVVRFTGTGTYGATDCSLSRVYLTMASDQSVTTTIPYATPGTDSAGKVLAAYGRIGPGPPEVVYPPSLIPGCTYSAYVEYSDASSAHGPARTTLPSITLPIPLTAAVAVLPSDVEMPAGSLSVGWTLQSTRALDHWEVTTTPSSAGCVTTGRACAVSGLTPGTEYAFVVTGVDADGVRYAAAAVNGTPRGRPATPTGVAASAVTATTATIGWTGDATPYTGATGYTVSASPGPGTCSTDGATTCEVTGLEPGQDYTFTVTASNYVGSSAASAPSAAVRIGAAPDAPRGVLASAASGGATVSWAAPPANGSSITAYAVESDPAGGSCTATAPATTCPVTGLTNGTSYEFRVRATNALGTGAWSDWSPAVIPVGGPGAVSGLSLTPLSGRLVVQWTSNGAADGTPITAHRVTTTPASTGCLAVVPARTCVLTGLTDGTIYTVTVTPETLLGIGATATASAAPGGVPAAPGGITAVAGAGGTATVSWASAGASVLPLSGHRVTASPGGAWCWAAAPATQCTISGLSAGQAYAFAVVAANAAGTGPRSVPTLPMTASASLAVVRATAGTTLAPAALAHRARMRTAGASRVSVRLLSRSRACSLAAGGLLLRAAGRCRVVIAAQSAGGSVARQTTWVVVGVVQ